MVNKRPTALILSALQMVQSRFLTMGPAFKYLALFAGIYGTLTTILSVIPPASPYFTDLVTEGAGVILSHLGFLADVYALALDKGYAEIRFNSTIYRVNEDCTGLSLVLLVAAGVAAIPAPLGFRLLGLILMSLFAAAIGCLRIVILGCVAEYHAGIFQLFHTYVMEVATVGIGLWILTIWFNLMAQDRPLITS